MVNWDKPLRTVGKHEQAELIYTLKSVGPLPRVVAVTDNAGVDTIHNFPEDGGGLIENVPEQVTRWVIMRRRSGVWTTWSPTFDTEEQAKSFIFASSALTIIQPVTFEVP